MTRYEDRVVFRFLDAIRNRIWQIKRREVCHHLKQRLKRQNISILSMNCTGGILYHDLGLQFQSPTINLYFQAEDFIRFCEHLDDYLAIDAMKECTDPEIIQGRTYPIAWLRDIKLFLVHYHSVNEAQEAWNRRKRRLHRELFVIATDRDGMTETLKDRFEMLPYRKVMFVHKPDAKHPSCFFLKGYEQKSEVGIITEPIGWRGKRQIDQFDYVKFFNTIDCDKKEE